MKLPKSQRKLLEALADGKWHSYREIVLATGKYSNLPGELSNRHERSLGAKGLVREQTVYVEKVGHMSAFRLTSAAVLDAGFKADLEEDTAEFLHRQQRWHKQYQHEEQEAKSIGLRHNSYLLLKALRDGEEHTFADLARATGIFSGLPQYLRKRHAKHKSLASMGLCHETVIETERKPVYAFQITKKGLALLDKLKAPC